MCAVGERIIPKAIWPGASRKWSDLIAVFSGKGNGFADHNFAGKLLGRTSEGKLLFGYCRLPWVDYDEPIVTVRRPEVTVEGSKRLLKIEVANHGQVASKPSKLRIEATGIPPFTAACPELQPYAKATIDVPLPAAFQAGKRYDVQITTGLDLQQPTIFYVSKLVIP